MICLEAVVELYCIIQTGVAIVLSFKSIRIG